MTAGLLVAGSLVIAGGIVLVVGVAVARIRKVGYDIDSAIAAHKERKAAGASPDILEPEPEEALS